MGVHQVNSFLCIATSFIGAAMLIVVCMWHQPGGRRIRNIIAKFCEGITKKAGVFVMNTSALLFRWSRV